MMKNLLVEFLIIILSFHLTASSDLNYQIVEIPQGSSSFSYEFINPSSDENYRTPLILMKFSGDVGITFYFTEELFFYTDAKELNYLIPLPVSLFTSNGFKSFELKFQNNNTESITMAFIDNSKEINISFEQFINWKHDLKYFMLEGYSSFLPIIFNIDTIPEKVTYKFNTTIEGSISSEDELLYYCIKNGNKCNYKPLNTLTFSEGKSYKIKLNPCTIYMNDRYFFFPPIQCTKTDPPKIDVQETQFGLKIVEIKSKEKKYYVVNTKSYNNLYIYTDSNYYYTFITEAQKNNLEDEIDNFIYENGANYAHLGTNYMDYLLIEIYNYMDYAGAIIIVNQVYEFYENYALQIKPDEYTLLDFQNGYGYDNNIIVSSENNMLLISDLSYGLELTNKISTIRGYYSAYIFVDSLNHTSTITSFSFNNPYDDYKFNIVTGNELENAFKVSGNDYTFTRTSSHTTDFGFNSEYFFDMKDKYYLYVKKYFGNVNFYSYNKQLDRQTRINEIVKPIPSYEVDDYKPINDEIIIISGYQFLTYYNTYGALYDIFIQKVNDFETININQSMSRFNNLVKLLNKDKIYTLNFKVDHYIKLDKKTSDAVVTFIDKNGNEYYLNSNNRLLKSLSGENIRVKSDKNALVYFYKKIEDTSKIKIIEFNNTISENLILRFSKNSEYYSKLYIVKDFGYKECYPLADEMNWDVVEDNAGILMIENFDERLECDLDEDEKYIVYIFDSFDENNLPAFHHENWELSEKYYNNSITRGNKYNFEILPPNIENYIILYSKNKPYITYQLIACQNQAKIYFNYVNTGGTILGEEILNENINYIDKQLSDKEDLLHFIQSEKEVLFAYHFHNPENYNQLSRTEYTIESVSSLDTNIIQIHFDPSSNSLTQYHIVISKKNEFNNIESFSNPCYIGKLMTHNSEDILVKTIFENSDSLLSINIDITPLTPKKKDILVIDIISNNMKSNDLLSFYEPVEYEYEPKEIIPLELDKEVEFELNIEKVYKYDYKMDDMVVAQLVFTFNSQGYFYLLVTEGTNTEKIYRLNLEDSIYVNLNKSATYYFQFISVYSGEDGIQNIFIATLRKSELIESIDLSKKKLF